MIVVANEYNMNNYLFNSIKMESTYIDKMKPWLKIFIIFMVNLFRAIYDGDDHAKFLEKLRARIDDHSGEIQKMCNFHYQGFIDSINELLQVKNQAAKLKVTNFPSESVFQLFYHYFLLEWMNRIRSMFVSLWIMANRKWKKVAWLIR